MKIIGNDKLQQALEAYESQRRADVQIIVAKMRDEKAKMRAARAQHHARQSEPTEPTAEDHADTPSLITRAKSLGRAIKSKLLDTPVPEAEVEARLAVCAGCEAYDPKGWCNACGCPKNKFTLLTVKAKIRYSTCPKGKWPAVSAPPPAT